MQQKCSIFNYVWNSNNYGAILTAYALSEILKNANIEVVNADCKIITYLLSQTKNLTFSTFKKNNLSLTENLNNFLKTNNTNKFSDIYITGSDQVFRIAGLGEHLYQYLLDFVNADKKKISFSASFGVNKEKFLQETSQDKIEHMKTSLKSFDFVSVREKSGVEICRDLFDVKAEWILDPVFILDRAKWDELIENATKDFSNKIVSYVLDTNKEYKKAHKYFSKKYNFEVIELANSNVSIENWLASIKNCEFLITDSFHGMCFAIIFNKPFICITNQKRGATRFESILEMLNIKNQCINNINEIYEKDCIFKVDYDRVNQRIAEEAQKGLDFLKKALEAPVSKKEEKIQAKMRFLENKIYELEKEATLKYQIKKELWHLWLIIFHKYLPKPIKNIIRFMRIKYASRK